MNSLRNRRIVALSLAVLLAVVVAVLIIFGSDRQRIIPIVSNERYDPGSGETVSDPPGKSPETFGIPEKEPIYLGFSKLLDVGISTFQIDALKIAFEHFSDKRSEKIDEISIFVATIKQPPFDPDSRVRSVSFDVIINRGTTYHATIEYTNIRSARLILVESGKIIFSSEVIDPVEYDYHDDDTP